MARLPVPGKDDDLWGDVLNEFLRVAHHDDGTPRTACVDGRRYPNLKAALDAIGTREETLLLSEPLALGVNELVVPTNVALQFLRHGSLVVAAGQALTVIGAIVAGVWQIFDVHESGKVLFGTFAKQAYPQWFGAVGDGEADDTKPLDQVFAALTQGGTVVFPGGSRFRITHGVDVEHDHITVLGSGRPSYGRIVHPGQVHPRRPRFPPTPTLVCSYGALRVTSEWIRKSMESSLRPSGTSGSGPDVREHWITHFALSWPECQTR